MIHDSLSWIKVSSTIRCVDDDLIINFGEALCVCTRSACDG